MRTVRTQQRYKCDFCKRRSTKATMELHEKICFRNPNRFCELCDNTGEVQVAGGGEDPAYYEKCFYCSKFDPKMLKEIEERENKL